MITPMQMYWLLKLDDINTASVLLFTLALFAFIGCFAGSIVYEDDEYYEDMYKKLKKVRNVALYFVLFFGAILLFLPTTKQMAAIYVVPAIANNERAQNIGQKTLDISEDLLKLTEDYIKDKMVQDK